MNPSGFTVRIVSQVGNVHWRCLEDAACGVVEALRNLGHEVQFVNSGEQNGDIDPNARLIVFNAHCLDAAGGDLSADAIIYNAEQVQPEVWERSPHWRAYLARLRKHVVWDYCATNIERLQKLGVERAVLCRVGYGPGARVILPRPLGEDVDVLFVGSINERRAELLVYLQVAGLGVETLFGVYGAERDHWIARAKIVLNIHFYPNPIFEIFRCSHLFANSKCVVTEDGGVDLELEQLARDACAYAPYDKIVETCRALVADPEMRKAQADRGRQVFTRISQIDEVAAALQRSE